MTGQPFTLLVDIPLTTGRADEFMALLNDVFEAMKVEETFVSATAYRNRYEARLPELLRPNASQSCHRSHTGLPMPSLRFLLMLSCLPVQAAVRSTECD